MHFILHIIIKFSTQLACLLAYTISFSGSLHPMNTFWNSGCCCWSTSFNCIMIIFYRKTCRMHCSSTAHWVSQRRIYGAFVECHPLASHTLIFKRKSTGTYIDVWCEAFCNRIIYFKTVFQSASEHAIFVEKIHTFSGEGAQPFFPKS